MNNKNILLFFLAVISTTISIIMVVTTAILRGSNATERTILALLSILICLSAHTLPALSRRPIAWVLWGACFVGTLFSHLSFFANAQDHAGEFRSETSVQVSNSTQQIEATKQALSHITARSVATVARELAYARSNKRRAALSEELDEAKRSERLQDALLTAMESDKSTRNNAATDPLLTLLSRYSGANANGISLLIGMALALILEMLGVFLWYELLAKPQLKTLPDMQTGAAEVLVSSGSSRVIMTDKFMLDFMSAVRTASDVFLRIKIRARSSPVRPLRTLAILKILLV
jgi:hypothetical protein